MTPSNVRKNKGTTECDTRTVTFDVGTAQYADGTINCEKKIWELPNVKNVQSHMMLVLFNEGIVSSNMRKHTGTTECNKSTVTCHFGTPKYEDCTIKCEKK